MSARQNFSSISYMLKEAVLKLDSTGVHAQLSSVILANQQFHKKMLL